MNFSVRRISLWLLFACGCVIAVRADIRPAVLFTDRAVLQRDKPVPIWGTAEPGEKITVLFSSQKREATAGHDGRWIVILEPMATNTAGCELTIAGKNTIVLRDVVVGEVWLCAGQSPFDVPLAPSPSADTAPALGYPLIRSVRIEHGVATTPTDTARTPGWQIASSQTASAFTSIAFSFARDLHLKVGVPIGLVQSTWAGTPIEAWLSPASLASDPAFQVVHERWPRESRPSEDPTRPSGVFNAMINPLLPFALRGVVWLADTTDAPRASEFSALFAAMITGWRTHFAQGDFPFYWTGAPAGVVPTEPDIRGRTIARLREAQSQALSLPNTGQAVTLDLGDPRRIQTFDTPEAGRRLALLARNRDYALYGDDTGPTFAQATREGANLRVRFTHVSGGLIAHNRPVQSLELAGADRVFHPADGRIERDTLVVTSPKVREPVAVRYAWRNAPDANLYNGAGLPAVPFRSDDW